MQHHVPRELPSRIPPPPRPRKNKCRANGRVKDRFATEIDAKMALAQIQAKDSSKRSKTEQRVYECDACKGFHMTSWKNPPRMIPTAIEQPTKKKVIAPQVEEGILALLNAMFLSMGSTEDYNAKVAKRIQAEVDGNPTLLERIIINEVNANYLDARAAQLIADVVTETLAS